LYGLAGINRQDKNGGSEHMEYFSSWKRTRWNNKKSVSEGFRGRDAVEKGCYVRDVCYAVYPFNREGGLFKESLIFG
jgi:hypothetical protein